VRHERVGRRAFRRRRLVTTGPAPPSPAGSRTWAARLAAVGDSLY
jgi:hypothetical protein